MRCVDVNVLVYAHRPEAPDHRQYLTWLEAARRSDEPLGLSSLVLSGFMRIVTHPRIFAEPTPLTTALRFVDQLRETPNSIGVEPGARHWGIFSRLCTDADVRGNRVPDAYLAAIAIEHGAALYSADRGLARFTLLDWRHPLEHPAR